MSLQFVYSYQELSDYVRGQFLPANYDDRQYLQSLHLHFVKGRLSSPHADCCTLVAGLNIQSQSPYANFPKQQQTLMNLAADYRNHANHLPALKSRCGYKLKRSKRDAISAVLMVVLAHCCFHSFRIGRYSQTGQFEFLSKFELARLAGFVYLDETTKQLKVHNLFDKAYQALSQSGYLFSKQIKRFSAEHGWSKAYKFISPKLIKHLQKANPGALTDTQFISLKKFAKKRWLKNSKNISTDRLKLLHQIHKKESNNAKRLKLQPLLQKLTQKRLRYEQYLRQQGFYPYLAQLICSYTVFTPSLRQ